MNATLSSDHRVDGVVQPLLATGLMRRRPTGVRDRGPCRARNPTRGRGVAAAAAANAAASVLEPGCPGSVTEAGDPRFVLFEIYADQAPARPPGTPHFLAYRDATAQLIETRAVTDSRWAAGDRGRHHHRIGLMRIDATSTTGIRMRSTTAGRGPAPALDRLFLPCRSHTAAAGIDRTVTVRSPPSTTAAVGPRPVRAVDPGVVGWVDLQAPPDDVELTLAGLRRDPKLVGIRHLVHEEPDDDWLARPAVIRGLAVLERHDVPYDLLLRPQHLRHVPLLSAKVPALRMVIDHIAKPRIREGRLGMGDDPRPAVQRTCGASCPG